MEDLRVRLARIETLVERDNIGVWTADQTKEYIEALLNERDRAGTTADRERELSAVALREEQKRAVHDGDERLRDHIAMQIEQIRNALVSADKLEMERMNVLTARFDGLQVARQVMYDAIEARITALEHNLVDRFAKVNEFRLALDDLGKQMATRRELETATGNVGERLDEHTKQLGDLRSRLDTGPATLATLQQRFDQQIGALAGQQEQRADSRAGLSSTTAIVGSVVGVIVVGLGILNYNALHDTTPPAQTTPVVTVTTITP